MPRWVGFAAGLAFASLIAIPVLLSNRGPADPALAGLPPVQAELVANVIEAVNDEDFDAFRSLFAADGGVGFETGLLRPYHQGVEAGQRIPGEPRGRIRGRLRVEGGARSPGDYERANRRARHHSL